MRFSFRAVLFASGAIALLSISCILDVVFGASGQQSNGTAPPRLPSIANIYCSPSGAWVGPTSDGPAKMPIECMYTALEGTPSPGEVRGPHSTTAEVQADINAAQCGDKVLVAAGSSLGPITLPAKKCDNKHWITIASSGVSSPAFPPEGTRMTPCWSAVASLPNRPTYSCPKPKALTFKIVTPNAESGIAARGGDHYRIIGAEITRATTPGIAVYQLVDLSGGSPLTNNIIFDRVWFHGVPGTFPAASPSTDTSTTRAIYLGQSNHIAVIDSYISDFYDTSVTAANGQTDAQCINGGIGAIANSGWGVYKFVNNHCEASGEGILLGGGNGPVLTPSGCTILVNCNADAPSDIEIRNNYFFKPLQWNGNTTSVATTGWPVVKNGMEFKTGARVLVEGNVIENCWYNAQTCNITSIAPINQQSGGTPSVPTCPTCGDTDFVYRYNYGYNVLNGFSIYAFTPGGCPSCNSQGANRVSVHDNLIGDNMNQGQLNGSTGDELDTLTYPDSTNRGLNQLRNVTIFHNTFVKAIRGFLQWGDAPNGGTKQYVNFTFQNNILSYGNYGWFTPGITGGCASSNNSSMYKAIVACANGWTWDHNAVFDWQGGSWPPDNNFFKNPEKIRFVDYRGGDSDFNPENYALQPSSPLHNAASDGKDLGADIGTLVTKVAGVRQ